MKLVPETHLFPPIREDMKIAGPSSKTFRGKTLSSSDNPFLSKVLNLETPLYTTGVFQALSLRRNVPPERPNYCQRLKYFPSTSLGFSVTCFPFYYAALAGVRALKGTFFPA